jgi:hypothetical protein
VGRAGRLQAGRGGGSQDLNNPLHDAIKITVYLRVPESQNRESLRGEKRIANLVGILVLLQSVLAAVSLDNDAIAERDKINNVFADGCLPSEMKAEAFQSAQAHPQLHFLKRESLSKRTGVLVRHDHPTPTGLPPVDPPHQGEG